uniref:BTB domain-containing protein n=1 Tax=Panagrellus redivivus TaxID=6233 RepID=A0A7E5A0H7_PANRE
MKAVKTVHDTATFTLNESDLTGKKVGQPIQTLKRDIVCSDGLKWWILYYPAGKKNESAKYVSVYLHVNKTVFTKYAIHVNGQHLRSRCAHHMSGNTGHGCRRFASHEKLRRIFVDGRLSITCNVEFDVTVPFSFLIPRLMRHTDRISADFEIVVGLDRLKVHKSLLSLISPVFNAMLSHDTAEAKSGKVDIKDFDFETVKAAIDFCYGREPENLCVDTIVGILRFADKYDIQAVTEELSKIPLTNLAPETFATIAHFAYNCSKHKLFKGCCDYFKDHQSQIVKTEKFAALAPSFVAHLLKKAFGLETQFDVLRHANANGILFILDPLEGPIIESLSLDTFCNVVEYAWGCSRENLKTVCGKYFNDNQADILKLKETFDLPPNIVYEVLKKGYDVL